MSVTARPCERHCPKCDQWKHHSRFRSRKRRSATSIGVAIHFDPICKDCQQIERNEQKNEDRPRAIIERRTADHARSLGVSKHFLWVNMNWSSLVPEMRALMTDEGRCRSCGHRFMNERDIQIEHREPPRHPQDWARQHARNIGIFCQSCNNTKGDKAYAIWLDEQEEARLSNEHHRALTDQEFVAPVLVQLTLDVV
jgi:hypothetical protein